MKTKIELGNIVKDVVTGFKGVAVARVEYLNGCIQIGVKPKVLKPGTYPETEYIDIQQLKTTKELIKIGWKTPELEKGGPQSDCPKH